MEYGNHRKHSAGARNVKARAKRALLLPSHIYSWRLPGLSESTKYEISFVVMDSGGATGVGGIGGGGVNTPHFFENMVI